jgi:HTH-type transcriptional regulator/antitoxin HigA
MVRVIFNIKGNDYRLVVSVNFRQLAVDPIEAIKLKMEERGLKAKDLEALIGSKGHVSSILSGRRELTLKMAQKLRDYFELPADIFMHTA